MNAPMETVFGLLGGLAVFLFGMNMMSEGLQKAAGAKMKSILSLLTSNPVLGVLAGAVATAVLQSSSATTVMAIGFVSARLMTMRQAIAVIFGANIGTTMTAQLMAFKLSDYIWLIVFVGFIVWFIAKDERIKNIGQTVFAFGLLFVGIDTMGAVMKPLAQSEVFLAMIEQVKDIPALGVVVGTVMTLVVQSSSATIAVLQSFASQAGPDGVTSVLGLAGSIPILLGDNIGTTITALLACIGQSRDAKRTAVAHSVFNISGALVFIWFVPVIAQFVQFLTPGPELDVIARQIANAHTTFNVVCTLLWLPFIGVMVKIVTFLVPGKGGAQDQGDLVYLDDKIVGQPVFAIRMFGEELQKYCDKVRDMLTALPEAIANKDAAALKALKADCATVEAAETELANYAVELLSAGATSEKQAAEISDLMFIVDAVGRIGARCGEVSALYSERLSSKKQFSDEARQELGESAAMVAEMYGAVLQFLSDQDVASERVLDERRRQIIKRQSKARKDHFRRVSSQQCAPENKAVYNQLLLCLERAGNECSNLVEHGAELSMWGDSLGTDRTESRGGGSDELVEALA
ncbi:MAG: Na/Pi cotransporter family protein [Paraeggerthella sp.]|nr:Na/Pi cotransporter family protein [Paraeggerthella sp.]